MSQLSEFDFPSLLRPSARARKKVATQNKVNECNRPNDFQVVINQKRCVIPEIIVFRSDSDDCNNSA